jgi:hypothetical protein
MRMVLACIIMMIKVSEQDYKPVSSSIPVAFPRPSTAIGIRSLYNGNIGAMSVKIINSFDMSHGTVIWDPLFYKYQYDQLNRLKGMKAYKGLASNQWTPVALDDYEEAANYDPNGNILSYKRNGICGQWPFADGPAGIQLYGRHKPPGLCA